MTRTAAEHNISRHNTTVLDIWALFGPTWIMALKTGTPDVKLPIPETIAERTQPIGKRRANLAQNGVFQGNPCERCCSRPPTTVNGLKKFCKFAQSDPLGNVPYMKCSACILDANANCFQVMSTLGAFWTFLTSTGAFKPLRQG